MQSRETYAPRPLYQLGIMTESLRTQQTVIVTEAAGVQVQVHVGGEVDLGSATALRMAIEQAVAVAAVTQVVVDLGEVGFLDSSGIVVLIAAHKQAAGRGVTLTVVNARGARSTECST